MRLPDRARTGFAASLLRGASDDCRRVVDEAVSGDAPLTELYELFRDGLYQVGDGWAKGQVSVAEEHRATAIVEGLMVDLFPLAVTTVPNGRRAISACVGSAQHQVGGRMVSDVLESLGWQCTFLPGDLPPGALVARVEAEQASLVALSVTMDVHLPDLTREVGALRARFPELAIIAGGLALREGGATVCAALERVTWIPDLDGLAGFTRDL
jgi:methanogenic corrinoid protein MtbC1